MPLVVTGDGWLQAGAARFTCALGGGGRRADKSEGDGATPVGVFPLRRVLYRADRIAPPVTGLPSTPINPSDGWCDDPGHPLYNQPVQFPFAGSAEHLWREDPLYDVLAVIGYNDAPVVPGAGSAIFLHVATPDYAPTEGCVALALDALLEVLETCGPDTTIDIRAEA